MWASPGFLEIAPCAFLRLPPRCALVSCQFDAFARHMAPHSHFLFLLSLHVLSKFCLVLYLPFHNSKLLLIKTDYISITSLIPMKLSKEFFIPIKTIVFKPMPTPFLNFLIFVELTPIELSLATNWKQNTSLCLPIN